MKRRQGQATWGDAGLADAAGSVANVGEAADTAAARGEAASARAAAALLATADAAAKGVDVPDGPEGADARALANAIRYGLQPPLLGPGAGDFADPALLRRVDIGFSAYTRAQLQLARMAAAVAETLADVAEAAAEAHALTDADEAAWMASDLNRRDAAGVQPPLGGTRWTPPSSAFAPAIASWSRTALSSPATTGNMARSFATAKRSWIWTAANRHGLSLKP